MLKVCSVSNFFNKSIPIVSDSESLCEAAEETKNNQEVDNTYIAANKEQDNYCDIGNNSQNKAGYTLTERRQMPTRASKESSSLGIKRRTIMKPAKRLKCYEDFKNLKQSEIKKIYLNKKLTKFRPSSLETIFEETPTAHSNDEELTRVMGGRKLKRSLLLSDGFSYSKTLVSRRRAKIKKNFGKRFGLKKISLEEFITKLNNSFDKNQVETSSDCYMVDDKSVISEDQHKMCQSNTTENFVDVINLSASSSADGNAISH